MEKVRYIASKNNWLLLMLGLLIGAFILFTTTSAQTCVEEKASTEQEDAGQEQVREQVEAVPSNTTAPPERQSYLIETIPEQDVEEEVGRPRFAFFSAASKVFDVLFSRIISPNAP